VKGVYNQLNELINRIQSDQSGRRSHEADEALPISIFGSNNNQEESTTGLDGRFLQSQLLITCLLKMETTETDRNEFISQCRQIYKTNKRELEKVDEFAKTYVSEDSLWWYTRDAFIYRLLNKALRIQNIDLLFLFRFYIRDIEKKLYVLHQHQRRSRVRVYRGQFMSKEELNVLKDSIDKLISVNSFLSTTSNRDVASVYSGSSSTDDTLEKVLFEIDADPDQIGDKPFADISEISCFKEEDEILMMVGSVFRLNKIYLGDNQIWHIEMTLCSDCDLKTIFNYMKKRYDLINNRLLLFANALIDMANFDDADKYLCRLLKELPPHHRDIPKCYHALGKVLCEKGNYDLSLHYFGKALQILRESQPNDCRIAYIHNNIGEVYQNKGDIEQALKSYKEALKIFRQTFPDDHKSVAWCYNNIGIIYEKKKKYSKARDYLEKALSIKQIKLPAQHPCLGNTYNNLGNVYYYLHEYDKALEKYELSYEIFKSSLTPRHPSIARALRNIGIVHEVKMKFEKAKKNYEEILNIREKILSSKHPDLIEIKQDIERISAKIK
jgi:tetratricopeptide (TPR) repeat protein